MAELTAEIERARGKGAKSDAAFKAQQEANRIKSRAELEKSRDWRETLVKASPGHYAMWLKGAVEHGVKITHPYTYPMPADFFVATRDIEITPLHGSYSVNIIAPAGVKVTWNGRGHNHVFRMDGFTHTGWIPLYTNIG